MNSFEEIREFKRLLDEGIITQEEFDKKKAELLGSGNLQSDEPKPMELIEEDHKDEGDQVEDRSIPGENTEPEQPEMSEEELEEIRKEKIYAGAVERLTYKTVFAHQSAIADLEGIADFKDAEEILTKAKAELSELEIAEEKEKAARKAKRKKTILIALIAVVAVVVIGIAIMVIGELSKTNLMESEGTQEVTINNMAYKIPSEWEPIKESTTDSSQWFQYNVKGPVEAVLVVDYRGETDLTAGAAKYEEDHSAHEGIKDLLASDEGLYYDVEADNSMFEISIYCNPEEVNGSSDLLDAIAATFDTEGYKNPRRSLGVKISYKGSDVAGTVIDSKCEDLKVTEKFETILGKGKKKLEWSIPDSVKLKADKTSVVKIKVGDKTYEKKIKCSTMSEAVYKSKCVSRNYKDLLRKSSYDKYIKIYGKVLQDCGNKSYRISSNGGYDDVYMVKIPHRKLIKNSDIVEDDWVTIYGVTSGNYTYQTVLGASKTIPCISVGYIERD